MKILHIIPTLRKGGAERMVVSICKHLQKAGHKVQICLLYKDNQYQSLTESLSIVHTPTTLELSMWKKNSVDVRALQEQIDAFQPDVVHSHLFESEINLAYCTLPEGCKRVVHFHDNMAQMVKTGVVTLTAKKTLTNAFERKLVLDHLPKQTQFIGISKDNVSFIKNNVGAYGAVHLLSNGIDLNVFKPMKEVEKSLSIVSVGTLNELKGHELALRAVKSMVREGLDTHLFLVGDGPEKENLRLLAVKLKIAHLIHFVGVVDHPEDYLNRSSVYVHTSKSEAFGLVLLEAMACGLPVVTTDGGGNRDLIEQGQNGYLIKDRSVTELADKIQYLLGNDEARMRMSTYAHSYAQQYGMEAYVEKLLAIYRS